MQKYGFSITFEMKLWLPEGTLEGATVTVAVCLLSLHVFNREERVKKVETNLKRKDKHFSTNVNLFVTI